MTLALLSTTGVGKAVNQLRNDETHGPEALRIVQKWKDMARSCGLKPKRKRSRSPSSEHEKSSPVKLKKKNIHSEDSGTGSSNEGTRKVSIIEKKAENACFINITFIRHYLAIYEVGDTPYFLLKPVLEKCSVDQLTLIEKRNPQLMEDSDELWEDIVNRSFPKCETTDDE
ncbi:unnamed protein product, partial [Gongylonema pulchrum]|uniref:TFIIS N-terminal domain-containing protein n=1 Tax=Gongylonema pulchrum TaxID=637853 RepID=A0A183EE33_9BILA